MSTETCVSPSICTECRGEAHFVLFPRNTRVKTRVACPACLGTGEAVKPLHEVRPQQPHHGMHQTWDVVASARRQEKCLAAAHGHWTIEG